MKFNGAGRKVSQKHFIYLFRCAYLTYVISAYQAFSFVLPDVHKPVKGAKNLLRVRRVLKSNLVLFRFQKTVQAYRVVWLLYAKPYRNSTI